VKDNKRITLKEIIKGMNLTEKEARKILRYANIKKQGYYWTFKQSDIHYIHNILKRYRQ